MTDFPIPTPFVKVRSHEQKFILVIPVKNLYNVNSYFTRYEYFDITVPMRTTTSGNAAIQIHRGFS